MKKVLSIICFASLCVASYAQEKTSYQEYVNMYYAVAVVEMERSGIPASITLAQGILESGSGNSALAKNANNHFGIKCHKGWTGEGYYMDDDEEDECFRVYADPLESYEDHSEFLMTRSRYEFIFEYDKTDYKNWAKGLKKAGYATNPKYADILISLVERFDLSKYDLMTSADVMVASNTNDPTDDGSKDTQDTKDTNTQTKDEPKDKDDTLVAAPPQKDEHKETTVKQPVSNIFEVNRIKTIKTKKGDTPLKLAVDYNISLNQIMKYNELTDEGKLPPNTNIFLQPKRKKFSGKPHKVNKGESMYDISQIYGIKMDELYSRNNMIKNQQPAVGQVIYLKKTRSDVPKMRSYDEVLNEKEALKPKQKKSSSVKSTSSTNTKKIDVGQSKPVKKETTITNVSKEETKKTVSTPTTTTVTKVSPEVSVVPVEVQPKTTDVDVTSSYVVKNHTVKKGDTLYSLSSKYKVTVDELRTWNNLEGNGISIGQQLIVGK